MKYRFAGKKAGLVALSCFIVSALFVARLHCKETAEPNATSQPGIATSGVEDSAPPAGSVKRQAAPRAVEKDLIDASEALIEAAKSGALARVQQSLAQLSKATSAAADYDINSMSREARQAFMDEYMDEHGMTALMYAASLGYVDIVKLLIKEGRDCDREGYTVRTGSGVVLVPTERQNADGSLDNVLVPQVRSHTYTPKGKSALAYAVINGHTEVVKLCLATKARVDASEREKLTSLLMEAGNPDIARLLIEKGAVVNATDTHKQTPLMQQIGQGKNDVAKLLIEKGADIHAVDAQGLDLMDRAVDNGQEELVKSLIEKGINVKSKRFGARTYLMRAVSSQDGLKIAKLLIAEGADVNARGVNGATALICACSSTYAYNPNGTKVVELLLDNGADINAKDDSGWTPWMYARASSDRAAIRVLLESRGARTVE